VQGKSQTLGLLTGNPLQTFVERYWFAVALSIGAVIWAWRTRRRMLVSAQMPPRPRPPSGSVGPVPFRGADFAGRVTIVQGFHSRAIGSMVALGLASAGLFAAPGLSHATRAVVGGAAAVGAFAAFLVLAMREGPLLRRLRLHCPKCGTPLVGGSEYEVPMEVVIRETGQCRCGAWILDPADLPSGQGSDERYLPPRYRSPS